MRSYFGSIFLALVFSSMALAEEPGLRLVYDVTETSVMPPGSDSPGDRTVQRLLTIRLAPASIAIREDESEWIYDFGTRRVQWLDHSGKKRIRSSLYAQPAFREMELANRRMTTDIMAAIGQKMDMVDAEIELGIRGDPPAKARLKESARDGARVFSLNGREVTTFLAADAPPPSELIPSVAHWLRYGAKLHPLVHSSLMRDPRLPRRLEFRWQLADSRTSVIWELRELVAEPFDAAAASALFPAGPVEEQGILALAFQVSSGQRGTAPTAQAYVERAEGLLAEGRGFEAFLVASEASFATGELPEELLGKIGAETRLHPGMQEVANAMAIEKSDPARALAELDKIDAQGLEGGHVIAVLRANQLIRLRMGDKALKEFERALAGNPFLVGAWADAGMVFMNGYQTGRAWACWDAARAIAPGHPLLKEVEQVEASLRRKYPEFF